MNGNGTMALRIVGIVAAAILSISGWVFGSMQIAQVRRVDEVIVKIEKHTDKIHILDGNQLVITEQLKEINKKLDTLIDK